MTMTSKRARKHVLASALTLAFGGLPMQQALAANCTWTPSTGNWNVAANWSCGAIPGSADTANIAITKVVTIDDARSILTLSNGGGVNIDAFLLTLQGGGSTTNTGTINVGSGVTAALNISAGHNITNTGGLINIATGSVVNQFGSTITGGTINTTGSGKVVVFNNGNNYMRGVTLNGNADVASNLGLLRIANGFTLNGSTSIDSGSLVNLEGTQTIGGSGSFVFGASGGNRLGVDGGNITATLGANMVVRGHTGTIGVGSLVNGSGNTLLNLGTISADSGGTINIAGATLANQNIVEATGAGSVLRLDSNVTNTGGTLRSTAAGVMLQNAVTVTGGSITNSGGGVYRAANNGNNFLSGVTLTSGSQIDLASAQSLERVVGGMTLNGTININTSSLINFEGDQTLGGNGSIVFGSTASNNRVGIDGGNKTLTVASGVTIRGENGSIGLGLLVNGSGNTLVNNGNISADVAGGTITLQGLGSGITNNGTISALNGGTIALQSNLNGGSGSQLMAGAGSVISQQGVTITGVINTNGSGNLRAINNGNNFLSGVTLGGSLDLASAQSLERVVGNLVLNGTINVNSSSLINFEGNQTLSGNGTIVFGATASNNRVGVDGGNKTLTLASGITIRGQNGLIGVGQLVNGSGNSIVNNGTISADVAGGVITLVGLDAGVTNNGTISALNGGTLQLQSNLIGAPGGQLVAGAGSLISQQGVTISGVINTSGSGSLRPVNSGNNTLSGVTLNGNLDMASAASFERVINNLTLNGIINIDNTSVLNFEGNQTLSGTGSIVFGATAASNRVGVDGGNKTLTIANGITIRGQNGTIGLGQFVNGSGNSLVNQGLISSDSGGTINMNGATFVNQSFAEAVGAGSVLRLDSDVTNTGGTLRSTSGGVVLQNGVVVTGGNITNSGSATYRLANSGSNYLSGVTLSSGSTIDMASAVSFVRVINGITVNGTLNIDNASVVNMEGTQTLAGTGSIVFGAGANNRVGVDGGNKTLTIASGVTIRGVNGLVGQGQFVNGSGNAIVNNGTINSDGGGAITIQGLDNGLTSNGLLRAQNGTMNVSTALSGSGTLQVDASGIMNLANGAKTQGTLTMGAAGAALNLGSGNLTITNDYTNTAAASGNSFNKRAGVSGAGLIIAGGNAAQAITGTAVTNGSTTNATLTIGNVRVNIPTTYNYRVANTGTTGPSLRGAIQTTANGATLTDPRLSGSGVTPSNYNTGAPGSNTGDLAVTITTATPGALAPLVNQKINLNSNFSNIADQKLNIVFGAGAAAYLPATGAATPSPLVTVPNQHVGGSASAPLTVTNTTAAGAFSEDLNASFGTSTLAASGTGSIAGRLAGTNNTGTGAMSVAVNAGTAGPKTGTVTLNYETAGAVAGVSNGLGTAPAGTQTLNVSGNVYRLAQANTIAPINFGNVLANSVQTRTVSISNLAASDGFSEALDAAFGAIGGINASRFSAAGSISGLLAQASNNSSMVVTLNTSSAGTVTANVQILLASNGTAIGNGLGITPLTTQTINLDGIITGVVGNLASAGLNPTTVNFGKFREGAATQTQQLTITNLTPTPAEGLNASFGANTGTAGNNAGTITSLGALASNSSAMSVTLGGMATAGPKSGTVALNFVSDGTFNSGVPTPLPSQSVSLSAEVYRLAQASVTPSITLAARRVGDAGSTGTLTIANSAAADNFSEGLRGTVGAAPAGFSVTGPASTGLLAAGTNTSRTVTLNTGTAGAQSGSIAVALVSNGAGTSGFGDFALPGQSTSVSGNVYAPAVGQRNTTSVNFGVVRVGDTVTPRNISVTNSAAAASLNDTLQATLSAASPLLPSGSVIGIAPGASNAPGSLTLGVNTTIAGVLPASASVAFASHNPEMADQALGSQSITVTGQINNLANGAFEFISGLGLLSRSGTDYTLDLGNITVGTNVHDRLDLRNLVAGPADDLSGLFDLSAADDFAYTGWGPVATLVAGARSGDLEFSFVANTLGAVQDTVVFNGLGKNASDLVGLAQTRRLLIRANIVNAGTVPEPGTLALLLMAGMAACIARRRRATLH